MQIQPETSTKMSYENNNIRELQNQTSLTKSVSLIHLHWNLPLIA